MDHRIDRFRLITLCFSGLAFLAMLICMPARAQTGQITGRVTDQHGSVLPNVGVTVVETSTTEQRTVQTNSDGYYTVPSLAPGPYSISLASQGFKSFSPEPSILCGATGFGISIYPSIRTHDSLRSLTFSCGRTHSTWTIRRRFSLQIRRMDPHSLGLSPLSRIRPGVFCWL